MITNILGFYPQITISVDVSIFLKEPEGYILFSRKLKFQGFITSADVSVLKRKETWEINILFFQNQFGRTPWDLSLQEQQEVHTFEQVLVYDTSHA